MIRLVCLDLAGTTVRDDGAVMAAFAVALAEAGLVPGTTAHADALRYAQQTMGQSKIEVLRVVTGGDEPRARQANRAFEEAYAAQLGDWVEPIEGAAQTIAGLRAEGVKVALTTGFSPSTRDALLAALGWEDLADLVLSPADAGRGRPYPDLVLTALLRLGIDDVRAVAVAGDTTNDLLAGWRAGASIVAGVLTGAHGTVEFGTVPHTHVTPSVVDLPTVLAGEPIGAPATVPMDSRAA